MSSSSLSTPSPMPTPPVSPGGAEEAHKRITWDLSMDLLFLRQIRGSRNLFCRNSTALEDAAKCLADFDARFKGLKKKGAYDRLGLLVKQHGKEDAEKKRKSGSEEEYSELDLILTEIVSLKAEKENGGSGKALSAKDDKVLAAKLRDDATRKLGEKSTAKSQTPDGQGQAKRAMKQSPVSEVLDFMQEKHSAAMNVEARKVALEEEKFKHQTSAEMVDLEKRKVDIMEMEAKAKLEAEKAERESKKTKDELDREERRMYMDMMKTVIQKQINQ